MKQLTRKQRREEQRINEQVQVQIHNSNSNLKESFWFIGFPIILIVILAGAIFYWTSPKIGEAFESQGSEHISEEQAHKEYNSNPPTSGPHAQEVDWGIYDEEVADERLVHNMEHGGIWISYKNLSDQELKQLESIAKAYPRRVVLTPRSKNDERIAVASWKRLMKLDDIDKNKIIEFIQKNTNKSPEKFAG